MEKHICCPTHCCQIHGCKYGYDDCPVVTKQKKGVTGSCENCGLEESGYYGDEGAYIHELEMENHMLKKRLKRFIVFTGVKDQCQNGWDAIRGDYDTIEEALEHAEALTKNRDDPYLWCQVVDTEEGKTIKECGYEVPS